MSSINSYMNAREWLVLVTLSILWGGSFFFVAVAVTALPPLTIVLLRVGLAALGLWSIAAILGLRPPGSLAVWGAFLAMGMLNNVLPFSLIVWGQTQISSGLASILNATTPLFTVIVAGALLADERLTPMRLAGVAVGFLGVAVMIGPSMLHQLGVNVLGQIAILGAALSYAFAGVFGRQFKTLGIDPVLAAAGQVTGSTLVLAPIVFWVEQPLALPAPDWPVWAAIAALGLASTALAYILYFKILATAGATNLLLVTLLVPVSAILLGSLVLGETLELVHIVGMGLVAVGLLTIDGRLFRRRGARPGVGLSDDRAGS